MKRILPAIIAFITAFTVVMLTGCSVTKYGTFFNASVGTDRSIQDATLTVHTNGTKVYHIKGYQSEQAQTMGAVAEGAIRGAIAASTGRTPAPVASQPITAPTVR